MRAVLRTRCGCRREIQVTFPPPPNILIPLTGEMFRGIANLQPLDPVSPIEAREFRLNEKRTSPLDTVYYDETNTR